MPQGEQEVLTRVVTVGVDESGRSHVVSDGPSAARYPSRSSPRPSSGRAPASP